MARLPRLYAPGHPQHVVMRCVAGRRFALDDDDFALLADLLLDAVRAQGVALHGFVLMENQWRLLATPPDEHALSRVVQGVGRRFTPHINGREGTHGALWDRRFRSTLVDADAFLLSTLLFLEGLPGRVAGGAGEAVAWRWSSLRHHLGVERIVGITDHAAYWSLGNTPFERQAAYQGLLTSGVPDDVAVRIEEATQRGWILGDAEFALRLAATVNRRMRPLARGRPPAHPDLSPILGPFGSGIP